MLGSPTGMNSWEGLGTMLAGLLGGENMAGQGSGFNPAMMAPPVKPDPATLVADPAKAAGSGIDLSLASPILQGLMGNMKGQPLPTPQTSSAVMQPNNVNQVLFPQTNPASIRNRLAGAA